MLTALSFALGVLWLAWVVQALLGALQVRKYAARFPAPRREAFDRYRPKTALIVPCKGVDPGFADHARRLCRQDHPAYRVVFVVESEDDPATPVLRQQQSECAESGPPIDVIVAGSAPPRTGQKVHNQLTAIAHLRQLGWGELVWAFADADAAPGPAWLGELVGPLGQDHTAVTTGYRWLVPAPAPGSPPAASSPTIWSRLASVLNGVAACFAMHEKLTYAWGGAMALRVDTAEAGDLVGRLRGALSDDFQVTALARALGRRVYFVRSCLVASPVALDGPGFWNFAHRQYLITRVHAPRIFYPGLAVCWLYTLGLVTAWPAAVYGIVTDSTAILPTLALIAGVARLSLGLLASGLRLRVIEIALGQQTLKDMASTTRLDLFGRPLWMIVNTVLLTRACFGRTLTWRGRRYRLDGPQAVREV